ncbi:MAG TPA: BACON domain-containing carbohydrate-binding protein, partial [Blastocatellia bacterium]|nr:BACON domain-containing carbohydrate-binding protein [Blastocatellia bacterium]
QYDVAAGSPTRGDWVDLKDTVTVFADRIETSTNAIKQSTYYFIAAQRPVTTAIGRVIENNGTPEGRPVAGATVRIRGREAVTDGNGGFVLRNVGVNGDGRIFADVNLLRANGQVDSKQSAGVQAVLNGVTNLGTIVLATDATPNRPPTALIPASILVTAGQQFDQPFTASDPDPGQTISLQVSDTRLAGIIARGGNAYTLRLNPALSDANTTIKLTLTVTDNLGAAQSFDIAVIVRAPCSYSIAPTNQAFTANGGTGSITITAANGCAWTAGSNATWLTITAGASGNGNGTVSYAVAANTSTSPRTGTLTVAGQTFTVTQAGANPVPTLTSLNPSSVIVGGAAFTLTVNGSNFVAGAVVRWNGSNRTTTFAGSTQLTAQIPATDIAVAGTANVTVFNPAPGGGVSNTTAFTISSGLQWQQRTSGLTGGTVREFAVSGTNLFAGTYGGVFRSTDNGSTWTAVNNGLTHTYINALTVSGTTLFAGTDYGGGVFRSADNGSTWTAVNNGLTASSVYALTVSGSTLFAGTDDGMFRSTDNGATWTVGNNGLTATRVFALVVSGSTLFAGTDGGGVFRSADNGANWIAVNKGLTSTSVNALEVSGSTLFAGTGGGGVFRSTDNGANWTPVNSGLADSYIYALTVSGTSLFAGTSGSGVYRSTDNGDGWIQVNKGLPNSSVNALKVSGSTLFTGTFLGGVYVSTNNGQSWTMVNNGLTHPTVLSFVVSGTKLFAGTRGSGVFVADLTGLP